MFVKYRNYILRLRVKSERNILASYKARRAIAYTIARPITLLFPSGNRVAAAAVGSKRRVAREERERARKIGEIKSLL